MTELYNPESRCPECDHGKISTTYHAQSYEAGCAILLCQFDGTEPHILRRCERCGYEFFQEPLSLKKAIEAEAL